MKRLYLVNQNTAMRFLLTLFLFVLLSFSGKSQTLNVFMSTTPETIYGGCNGTITLWVEGASAADSFMFLLDFDPLPVEYDTIIIQDTIVTITGVCPGSYTATLDTLWGSCPIYGGGCCNCIGSTSCGGAAGAGASGTVGAASPALDFTINWNCPDVCGSPAGQIWLSITGDAPPYEVNFTGNWLPAYQSYGWGCSGTIPNSISVRDATGQIVSHSPNIYCAFCGKSATLNAIPTIEVCAGEPIGSIDFDTYLSTTGMLSSTIGMYSWTNNNTATGIPSGSMPLTNSNHNDIFSFTAANVTSTQTSTITLVSNPWYFYSSTASQTSNSICNGNTITFNVIVHPIGNVNAGNDLTVCSGDQVTLSGSGGTSYIWNNGVVDNVAFTPPVGTTTYQVTGASALGCDGSDQVQITVNALPTINAGIDQSICAGAQVTLSGSGGTSYTWDNGISNNVAFTPTVGTTTYSVTGTGANGCENTDQVEVTVNSLPTINAGIDQTICDGDQIALAGSGGATYVWDNGISDNVAFTPTLGTTTYEVTGTDANGCENTDQVEVTVNELPTIVGGVDTTICFGDSVFLAAIGNGSIDWTGGIANNSYFTPVNSQTELICTAISTLGCQNSDTILVNMANQINTSLSVNIADIVAVSGYLNYEWQYCGSDVTIQNGAQNTFTALQDGNYKVVVRNSENCYDTSECVLIDYLDVNDLSGDLINLSPNPTTGKVFISNSDQLESIVIFDAAGRVVQKLSGKTNEIDFSGSENGHYIVQMMMTDKRVVMARIIKHD